MLGTTLETIAVIVIVASVLALGGRSFYRAMTGKNKEKCCGCDSCHCQNATGHEPQLLAKNIYENIDREGQR